jgi:hypothetical protein
MDEEKPQKRRNRNGGIRKRCPCPRKKWSDCRHPWHFNFKWKGQHYRISLDREVGKHIDSKAAAITAAEGIRTAIRSGQFGVIPNDLAANPVTFHQFAKTWKEQRGAQLVRHATTITG